MKILLINDTSSNPNFGCQANTAALYYNILLFDPMADIDCIILNDLRTQKLNRSFTIYRKGVLLQGTPDKLDIKSYDLAIVNGEGSLGDNKNGNFYKECKSIFSLISQVHSAKVPVHLINFTHHINHVSNGQKAKRIYLKCASVSVRETASYRKVKKLLPNVKLYPDLSCTLTKPGNYKPNGTVMVGGGTCLRVFGEKENIRNYTKIVQVVLDHNLKPQLVGWPAIWRGDDIFFTKFAEGNKHVEYFKPKTYLGYLNMCKISTLNITGRHHGVIMSFATGCPVVPIEAESCKVAGDAELYLLDQAFHLTDKSLLLQLKRYLANVDNIAESMRLRYKQLTPFLDGHIRHIWEPKIADVSKIMN